MRDKAEYEQMAREKVASLQMQTHQEAVIQAGYGQDIIEATRRSGEVTSPYQCSLCLDRTRDTFYKPCGHTLYCTTCLLDSFQITALGKIDNQKKCDLCRREVTHVLPHAAYKKTLTS
jgi:hypothetical protein